MKILITGGAGFIASHVTDALISKGHQVCIIDNLATGFRENVNPNAKFYLQDIRDDEVEKIFETEKPDIVDHHAAQMDVRRSVREPLYDAGVNVLGTLKLLELSRIHGVKKFIYISTGGAVYGEPKYIPVDENHPIDPLSPYGVTKHTPEHYLKLYKENFGISFTVLRYPNVYGPRQSPHGEAGVIAIFSENMLQGKKCLIFGDGSKTRDYVYISDIVKANLAALERGEGGIYNLGSRIETTDLQIFEGVRDALGVKTEPVFDKKRAGEIDRIALTNDKAKKELGWKPDVKLKEGIRLSTAFYIEKLKKKGLI